MKSLFTVATIIALVFFFGCSEKKKSEADIDGQSNADSDLEEDTDEVEKTDVEPDGPEIITENENEQTDAEPDEEVKDTETTDDIVTDSEPDEENDEDVVEPLPSVIYVNESAEGAEDGTSWENAFMDLQSAIDAAVEGDQIWVAAGKYKPTSVHGIITMEDVYDIDEFNRYLHFRMKNGVEIYGGFAGTETELSQRDFEAHETILSCDLGEIDEQYDNC
ncbi:MAG TPA: hypothetical protein PLT70_08235, partial [bacterium]|nr:hypothetical protein [bacterium]